MSLPNKTDFSADLRWLQSAKLNGIFRKFKVIIEEILADNTYGVSRTFHIDANMTSLKLNSNNASELIPVYHYNIRKDLTPGVKVSYDNNTGYFSFRFIGLRPFTNYVVNISSCTNPGCGDANMISFRSNETGELKLCHLRSHSYPRSFAGMVHGAISDCRKFIVV